MAERGRDGQHGAGGGTAASCEKPCVGDPGAYTVGAAARTRARARTDRRDRTAARSGGVRGGRRVGGIQLTGRGAHADQLGRRRERRVATPIDLLTASRTRNAAARCSSKAAAGRARLGRLSRSPRAVPPRGRPHTAPHFLVRNRSAAATPPCAGDERRATPRRRASAQAARGARRRCRGVTCGPAGADAAARTSHFRRGATLRRDKSRCRATTRRSAASVDASAAHSSRESPPPPASRTRSPSRGRRRGKDLRRAVNTSPFDAMAAAVASGLRLCATNATEDLAAVAPRAPRSSRRRPGAPARASAARLHRQQRSTGCTRVSNCATLTLSDAA